MLLALEFNHDFQVYHPALETLSFQCTFRPTGGGHQIIQTGRKTFLMPVSHQSRVSGSKVVQL